MGFCCSTAVQENVDPGIIVGKSPRMDMYKEVQFEDESPIDHWTKMDWEQLIEIQAEEMALWDAMPETVKQKGEEFLGEMMTPDGKFDKEKEDDKDFFMADKNKDGRLTYEEYKILWNRVYDEDVKRFGGYVQYNESQLSHRYKFYCALAKSIYGPSRNTMRKHKLMVSEYYFALVGLKSQIKNPDQQKVNVETTWSVDEIQEFKQIVNEDMQFLKTLPEQTQENIQAFMDEMRTNYRVKLDQEMFDLKNFQQSDKDGDGRLSYQEFIDYITRRNDHFKQQFDQWIQKTEQQNKRDYEMLCKLAYCQQGPTISTLAKATNIMLVIFTSLDLDGKKIEVQNDMCQVDQWTKEQFEQFVEINNETENHLMQNLPPNMYEFQQKYMSQCIFENFSREMLLLQDQILFTNVDMNKDGHLKFNEFQNYIQERQQAMENELGGKFSPFSYEQVQKMYKFICDIGNSNQGPTIRAFEKWMNMWIAFKKSNLMGGTPTLHYFDQVWARGEPIRMALWKAGIHYNDNLISNNQWLLFRTDKVKCPKGQLPTFELADGQVLSGTTPILGYIGDICQLHAQDPLGKARSMSLYLTTFSDLMDKFPPILFSNEDNTEKFQELIDNDIVPWFKMVESYLAADKKFLAGNTLTIYDFAIGGLFTNLICNPNARNTEQLMKAWENAPARVKKYHEDFCVEMKPYLDQRPNNKQYDL